MGSKACRRSFSSDARIGDLMRVEVDLNKCTGHGICEFHR